MLEVVPETGGVLSLLTIRRRSALAPVTPAMLAAGRAAFKSKRKLLSDLWQAYDCDIDAVVRHIFREMTRAGDAG